MDNLVIGCGEIGTAISKILDCEGIDINQTPDFKTYKCLHICFPYSEKFIEYVENYRERFSPDYIIVHSTVPVGTCKKMNVVHSPVRGVHPELEEGIRTFVKYFGGDEAYSCSRIFADRGLTVHITSNSDDTEAMKIWDTTVYGVNILLEKEIHKFCQKNGLDFDLIYTEANKTYNEGYEKLGHPEFKKYNLKHMPGEIGGHCILPNIKLLESKVTNWFND